MYTTLISAPLISLIAARAVHANFSVQTPVFTQCALAQFSWDQTTSPYNIILVNQTDPCGEEVANLGDYNSTNLSWNVSVPAGWNVLISIEDANGDEAWSGAITIQPSNNTGCLSSNSFLQPSSTTTSPRPSRSVAKGSAGVKGTSAALPTHSFPVRNVLLGIIGFAFALIR
ncbi:hypothetical protein EI94DRAFT_942082 [Lactarius quietus]|nr:hypothetical protein EI94DRAFT_942082 [Lactarius quietus]